MLECGVSDGTMFRRVRSGLWERVHVGVYRSASSRPTWRGSLFAACVAWGNPSAASHDAAAALHRLTGFDARTVEVTVPRGRNRAGPGNAHRTNALDHVDVEVIDAIPVTTVARTLIDLAGSAPRDAVEAALDDALYRGLVSRARLRWRLEVLATSGRRGSVMMRDLLAERVDIGSVPQSQFETKLLRLIHDQHLPVPETQYQIRFKGKVVATVDFAYPDARLAIEADGRRFHSGRIDFERDRDRANALSAMGWRVLRITWTALHRRPAAVAGSIRATLSR